ncbi:MAG: rhodanese-like domain-containing protein [Colwellia sp.]
MLKTVPEILSQIKPNIQIISALDAQKKLLNENGILVDVREPGEFNEKSAKNAINIPRGLLEMKMLQMHPNASLPIFIHCATAARACFAAEQLQRVGYEKVYVVSCGLDDICNTFE